MSALYDRLLLEAALERKNWWAKHVVVGWANTYARPADAELRLMRAGR